MHAILGVALRGFSRLCAGLASSLRNNRDDSFLTVFHNARNDTGDARDSRRQLRHAALKDLLYARKTHRDVAGSCRHPSRVESAHRKLRPRLADRLRGHNADTLANVDKLSRSEIGAIALLAYAARYPARHGRADRHLSYCTSIYHFRVVGAQEGPALHSQCLLEKHPSDDPFCERPADILLARAVNHDTVFGAAIVLKHNNVVRNVKEPPREIARARGVERGVGETFARAVRRNEILDGRKPLLV